jgi:tetratricopeptide (TPR) repeat protein
MTNRLETLKSLLSEDPGNSFARYGLAMEYSRAGRLEEALAEFEALLKADPGYSYAYFHGGQALEQLGRIEEAKDMYRRGLEAATRKGDQHARSELQGALDLLG